MSRGIAEPWIEMVQCRLDLLLISRLDTVLHIMIYSISTCKLLRYSSVVCHPWTPDFVLYGCRGPFNYFVSLDCPTR